MPRTKLVPITPKLDARYIITLADLQRLRNAQMAAKLALEPKPGYKPASRDIMATALKCCVDVIDNLNLDDYIPAQLESFDNELERRVISAAEKVSDWSRVSSDFSGPGKALDALYDLADAVDLYRAGEPDGTGADLQNQTDSVRPTVYCTGTNGGDPSETNPPQHGGGAHLSGSSYDGIEVRVTNVH
jgi:hypothetical protein